MKVRELMTTAVHTCQPDADLGAVAVMMWDHDCGFVPVIDASGTVAGLVTDRDICMAAATRGLAPNRISAAQAMSRTVHACLPDDSLPDALTVMKKFKVRRLPVIDAQGLLKGVISLNDITRAATTPKRVPAKDLIAAFAEIGERRTIR
jgi:CBS domain-containing protein